ncbi:MAG: ribosomal L7Ae/L30e/S12e/Gadd45 family protein [Candidatus Caldatribacterium sp.]|uniref:L7Ae/L30e/S12e/Gadd45 family ribosomal protein n=1 Tax=Candidatus Caldatribacterium sp. TaxID=2282143 RepID=UPI0029956228|nr:ribosomal L7Ae/L30e/S12e/Gadd45 family protein [Candidatus Caldatribacterium sp.]MCX7731093.1 ribosomal L7Ae/L30e/S12e/Gadd45 family protein [Candidatus Caldatribacterium sp.]MDW8081165.1 ribosomal L7Ae/L30e/S12e/Gadd45 family protein [Candidatus Calescibacterium sp.]
MGLEELRGARRVVGFRETQRAIERGRAKKVFVALDVDETLREAVVALARAKNIPLEYVPSAQELGRVCGIEVRSSCAAIVEEDGYANRKSIGP